MGAGETLAAAVLGLAIEDMGGAKGAKKKGLEVRDELAAEKFLFNASGPWQAARHFWCSCANVDPAWFEKKVVRHNVHKLAGLAAAYRTQYNQLGGRERR
ncbi:MAG: hypothetical protein PHX68_02310 [Alphaproteobacteria bacterium]|nr:hypothetical protein [Alphaproteobacteria bacterium]